MFKIENTIPPHSAETILLHGARLSEAKKAMIMIHGRGAQAESVLALADHFKTSDIIYIAPQANNYTWYPYRFIEKRDANEPGITSGLKLIDAVIKKLNSEHISNENIFLLGFSQGACLAVDYAARNPGKYAGVFCLSGGLIGEKLEPSDYQGDMKKTPVFLGCSENDFHIPEERVHESADIFTSLNAAVTKRIYPNLGHTINRDELAFINKILETQDDS
jgi:phospholipase/carboxylesterase